MGDSSLSENMMKDPLCDDVPLSARELDVPKIKRRPGRPRKHPATLRALKHIACPKKKYLLAVTAKSNELDSVPPPANKKRPVGRPRKNKVRKDNTIHTANKIWRRGPGRPRGRNRAPEDGCD